ncbi:MAG: AAA family ATPase [Armatimonadetes bacterium]|nr:AAA family ATPase [Armatimonadota bacterium]
MRLRIPDPSLVILCGPAGSGKSTFARNHFRETAIVSTDRLRAMISDDESNMAVSGEAFDLFHQITAVRLRHGLLAVVDSTAVSKEARRELRQLGRRAGVPVTLIVFDISEATAVKWNEARERRVGRPVIRRQWEQLQEALKEISREAYDEVVILSEDNLARVTVELVRRRRGTEPAARAAEQGGTDGD